MALQHRPNEAVHISRAQLAPQARRPQRVPFNAHAVEAHNGPALGRRRDMVLPGRLPKQRRCAAPAAVEPDDDKVERVDPRREHLGAAVVADCGRRPVAAVPGLVEANGARPVERPHAAVDGPTAIAVVADALLREEARQAAG